MMPSSICLSCVEKVCKFCEFYEFAHENQLHLKNWLSNRKHQPTNIIESIDSSHSPPDNKIHVEILDDENIIEMVETAEGEESTQEMIPENDIKVYAEDEQHVDEQRNDSPNKTQLDRESKAAANSLIRKEEDDLIKKSIDVQCPKCLKSLPTIETVLSHMQDVHNEPGYLQCCGRRFTKRFMLLEHVYFHIKPEEFVCPTCFKRFTTKRQLKIHINLHLPEEDRDFPCTKCEKRYTTTYRLKLHMNTHNEELKFVCPTCGKA